MSRLLGILAFLCASFAGLASAQAKLDVRVDIPAQRMQRHHDRWRNLQLGDLVGPQGFPLAQRRLSPDAARAQLVLAQIWRRDALCRVLPRRLRHPRHDGAVGALGRPASHGCIRLHPAHAAKLFALVKKHGSGQHPHRPAWRRAGRSLAIRQGQPAAARPRSPRRKLQGRSAATRRAAPRRPKLGRGARADAARPALPASAFGYQLTNCSAMYETGPRWRYR
jgi:hypothetical protein